MIAVLYIDPRGPYPALTNDDHELFALDGRSIWSDGHEHRYLGNPNFDSNEGDARLYDGPGSVIAHPPCKHWGRLRHLAHWRCLECARDFRAADLDTEDERSPACPNCGGEVASDRDCAPRAVEQVRAFGGVLEHPAGSKLWEACGLPLPAVHGWQPHHFTGGQTLPCGCGICEVAFDASGGYTIELDQVEWGHVARKRTWLYLVGVPREALEPPPFPGREPTHYASGGRTASSRNGGAVPAGIKVCSAQQRRRTPQLFAEYLVRLARAAGAARKAA